MKYNAMKHIDAHIQKIESSLKAIKDIFVKVLITTENSPMPTKKKVVKKKKAKK